MPERIERIVGRLLRGKGLTLAVAESCTGGLVGHRLTQAPGCSSYFLGGVIAYRSTVKTSLLGISEETLARYGAVSKQTAAEMARGARRLLGADAAIAVTGIAGPGGGSGTKPVGLVYLALAYGDRVIVRRHLFNGSRSTVKSRAADTALKLLGEHLRAKGTRGGRRGTIPG